MSRPDNIILEAIVGSTAYGLDTEESDIDTLGIFVRPTVELLGLSQPSETINGVNPDYCLHEVSKFMRLALVANPTILELLYLDEYLSGVDQGWGKVLVDNREIFLSSYVAKTYFGYAKQQFERLYSRDDGSFKSKLRKRYSKHARHLARLLQQGEELMLNGTITVKVPNKDEIFAVGELEPDDLLAWWTLAQEKYKDIESKSILPAQPDRKAANDILVSLRKEYLYE